MPTWTVFGIHHSTNCSPPKLPASGTKFPALVTSLDAEILTLGQLYRDRADCENIFDELKNQWGWGGFTTHDLARCRLAPVWSPSSTTGGTCSFGSQSPLGILRRSPAGYCS
jgi:hypothetical protein